MNTPASQNPAPPAAPKVKKKIKPWMIVVICVFVVLLGVCAYILFRPDKSTSVIPKKVVDTKVANNLDGVKVDPSLATRHPLAVAIENHPDSRPQTGLDKAAIVYEAITEGGITRFLAVYGPYEVEKAGPVRSARTYFIDWLSELDAFYAHCGGNLDALDKIISDNIMDLDQFAVGDKAYWREPEAGKATEHTMYTDIKKLYDIAFNEKNWPKVGNYSSLKFKKALEETQRGAGQKVIIDFSSPSYNVSWTYDKATDKYLRFMAGVEHKDKVTDTQLTAVNVVVQEVERWEAPTSIGENGWAMKTIGEGKAQIFSEGKQITGTWKKAGRTSRTIYYDDKGTEIEFAPGRFWIEIVPPDVYSTVKVEPLPVTTPPATN